MEYEVTVVSRQGWELCWKVDAIWEQGKKAHCVSVFHLMKIIITNVPHYFKELYYCATYTILIYQMLSCSTHRNIKLNKPHLSILDRRYLTPFQVALAIWCLWNVTGWKLK